VSKQKEELSETNKVKDKLFSIIGHDLRGPVGSIATVIDLMNGEDMDESEKKEMLGMLQKQTQYTMETLDTLLLWGKTQIADNQVHMENINAGIYVQNNLNLLQYELKNKRIQLVNETFDNSLVYADKAQFDFVVRNLLTNAVKYSEQGGIVTIGVDYSSNRGYTTLKVKDNGVGMSETQSKNLFMGFGVTTPGTNNEVGTGIGLMLCHEFVTANGGKIWVDTQEGKGTTFYCTFRNV
jgi:signal transduction histidine kinase